MKTEGPWERKRRLMSREIENVALTLFEEKGFDHVTVEEISQAVGMSTRTFFRYFTNKNDILVASPKRALEALSAAILARPADEPLLESWKAVALAPNTWSKDDIGMTDQLRNIVTHSKEAMDCINHFPSLKEQLLDCMATKLHCKPHDLKAQIAASVIHGAMSSAISSWPRVRDTKTLGDVFAETFDILCDLGSLKY
ncbi:TetR family transcriptional regulator [Spongiibacter sp. KMU-166]|uniref:TetR family transcriptional regulator n=1 Tax=Spongiibacter thalassae TaxID=2721624 RepID=A0ABX1GCW7_9GAMM|nr:TetR family transcriptional regulator [Spongiibacter thalassae]NKI16433.1 TetR family transcriptional regulator [Spongiibacter thalassae]